jgi:drug/metabolite transporter superfamily protein YnfA
MDTDYVIFFVAALFVVIGAGLFRVGLMNLKSESLEVARKHGRLSLSVLASVLQQC